MPHREMRCCDAAQDMPDTRIYPYQASAPGTKKSVCLYVCVPLLQESCLLSAPFQLMAPP